MSDFLLAFSTASAEGTGHSSSTEWSAFRDGAQHSSNDSQETLLKILKITRFPENKSPLAMEQPQDTIEYDREKEY